MDQIITFLGNHPGVFVLLLLGGKLAFWITIWVCAVKSLKSIFGGVK